jgi:hypothetical protein
MVEKDQQATLIYLQPRSVVDHIGERVYVVFHRDCIMKM